MKASRTFSLTAVLWTRTGLGVSDLEAKTAMQCFTTRKGMR